MKSSIDRWKQALASLPDSLLLDRTREYVGSERGHTAWLVAHLAEVERRDLALQAGHPSLYKYARHALGLTDQMAYERAYAARLALQLPETIGKLVSGELTLATACELFRALKEAEDAAKAPAKRNEARNEGLKLAPELPLQAPQGQAESEPHTKKSTCAPVQKCEKRNLLERVSGKTRRESEALLQDWKRERVGIEAPERSQIQELRLQLTDEQKVAFDRLRDLLSHKLGGRSPEAAFVWMLELGLEKLDPVRIEERAEARRARAAEKKVETNVENEASVPESESPDPDHIPAETERRVWIRCDGKCQYPDPTTGGICRATAFLDCDHIVPKVEGGTNGESNLRLCCSSHNRRRQRWQAGGMAIGFG